MEPPKEEEYGNELEDMEGRTDDRKELACDSEKARWLEVEIEGVGEVAATGSHFDTILIVIGY